MYQRMVDRKELGLWDGSINVSFDNQGKFTNGYVQVQKYEGVWVFAENMDKVKQAYQSVGVSGQAELFI
jgi:hypothetical protein